MSTKLIVPREERQDPLIHKKTNKTAINKDSLYAINKETDKKVRGQFINIECPGQPAKVCGKYYKGMPYFQEVMEDGQYYTIPWSVARFINEECKNMKANYLMDEKGNPLKGDTFTPRYKFIIEQFL